MTEISANDKATLRQAQDKLADDIAKLINKSAVEVNELTGDSTTAFVAVSQTVLMVFYEFYLMAEQVLIKANAECGCGNDHLEGFASFTADSTEDLLLLIRTPIGTKRDELQIQLRQKYTNKRRAKTEG